MIKLTDLQKEVKHEIQRINRLLRRYTKQGYEGVPEQYQFDKAKARTRTLERLKNIGRKDLLKKATYSGEETGGKTVKAEDVPKLRRKRTIEKKKQNKEPKSIPTFSNIYEVRDRIANLPSSRFVKMNSGGMNRIDLSSEKSILQDSISEVLSKDNLDIELYEAYLTEHAMEIDLFSRNWTYDSTEENVRYAASRLLAIIVARPLSINEQERLLDEYEPDEEEIDIDLINNSNII